MTMETALRDYLSGCLREAVHWGYLPMEPGAYSLEPLPGNPVEKRYMDGGELRCLRFTIATRWLYDLSADQTEAAAAVFRGLDRSLREKNDAGALPELGEKAVCLSLRMTDAGAVQSAAGGLMRFQSELELRYFSAPQ